MSLRRLNYTNRQKIRRNDVSVAIDGLSGGSRAVVDFDLTGYGFPDEAPVFLEAYAPHESFGARSLIGTARQPSPAPALDLSQFSSPSDLLFRLKVVTPDGSGRLLGKADQLRPEDESAQEPEGQSLLPVVGADIGERLWWLVIEGDTGQPTLLVSRTVENFKSLVRTPAFVWLVFPSVLRSCLEVALESAADEDDLDEDAATPLGKWLLFGVALAKRPAPGASDDPREKDDWIQDAVNEFCRSNRLRHRYLSQEAGEP